MRFRLKGHLNRIKEIVVAKLGCDMFLALSRTTKGILLGIASLLFAQTALGADFIPTTPGTGVFDFNHNGKTLETFYYVPENLDESTPIWIIMHGQSRTAENYRDRFVDAATAQGVILIAPKFNDTDWSGSSGYSLGNITSSESSTVQKPKDEWAFSYIEPLFSQVKGDLNVTKEKYNIFGHSAGGQFVHRFVEWMPEANVNVAIAANPGWYTMAQYSDASYSHEWPYSLEDTPTSASEPPSTPFPVAQLENALSTNLIVLLGDQDTSRTNSLRTTSEADAQGRNRLERGQFFFNEGKAEAAVRNVPFGWDMKFVQGIGHSSTGMAKAAAAAIFRFAEDPIPEVNLDFPFNDSVGSTLTQLQNSEGILAWDNDIVGVTTDGSGVLQVASDGTDPPTHDSTIHLPLAKTVDGEHVAFARMIVDIEPWNFVGAPGEEIRFGFGNDVVSTNTAQVRIRRTSANGIEMATIAGGQGATDEDYVSLCNDQDDSLCKDTITDPLRVIIDLDKTGNSYEVRYQHGDRPEYIFYDGQVSPNRVGNVLRLGFRGSFDEPGEEFRIARYQVLAGPTLAGFGDMNGDGVVDSFDVNPFVLALTDRASFDSTYPEVNADVIGDFNNNGQIDLGDISGFTLAIPGSSGQSVVPEPTTPLLLAFALLGWATNRQMRFTGR